MVVRKEIGAAALLAVSACLLWRAGAIPASSATGVDRMKHVVVKIGLHGEVYWDGKQIGIAAFKKALSQLKTHDGYLTYYREAPDEKPSKAVFQTFMAIVDSRNKIQLGPNAPSEGGTLASIEIEEDPGRFRFAIFRGYPILCSFVPDGQNRGVLAVGHQSADESWFRSADLMVRSDRIIETPPHEPEKAFSDPLMRVPSLHLSISYDKGPQWKSWYPINHVPSNVRSLYRGCRALGMRILGPPPWKNLSAAEALHRAKEFESPKGNR